MIKTKLFDKTEASPNQNPESSGDKKSRSFFDPINAQGGFLGKRDAESPNGEEARYG